MSSITIDRTDGLSSSTAVKGPVRVATTANIALTGLQTIDGVALAVDDRVLVKDQTTATENGIWVCDTGPWRRAKDFSNNRDIRTGTRVWVTDGTHGPAELGVTTANPVVIGTSNIVFASTIGSEVQAAADRAEAAAAAAGEGVAIADDRTVLSLVNEDIKSGALLKEDGREGLFIFDDSDLSAEVALDTAEGSFVAPDAGPTGAGGAWKRIRPYGNLHKVSEYGGDVLVAIAVAALEGGTVELGAGTTVPTSALLLPANVDLVGQGDTSIVNLAALSSGQLSGLYAIKKDGAGLTTLGSFTSIVALDEHITFAAPPDVSVGQIICIYDSADGSFLPETDGFSGRDYYRRGQRARVVAKSGNTIYLDQAIREAYASGGTTTVYKQASTTGRIGGLRFDATGYVTAGNRIFRARYGDRLRIEDCNFIGAAYASCEIDQCYETEINRGTFETDVATASANSYPLSILNSAHTRASGFAARGKWNGIGTGGDDIVGAIQSYDTVFEDFRASGTDAPGVDMHGNSELTRMARGVIDNGISFGGKDTYYKDCHVTDKDYLYAALWAEVWGGDQHFEGGSISIGNASTLGRFNIDAFGGAAFRAAQAPTNIKIHTKINAPNAARLMGLRLDSASQNVNFDIKVELDDVGSLTTFREIYKDVAGNAGDFDRVAVSGLPATVPYTVLSGAELYTAAVTEYPRQKGVWTVTPAAAPTEISALIDLRNPYPTGYPVQATATIQNAGSGKAFARMYAVTVTQIRPMILTGDGTNLNATSNIVGWEAF